MAKALIKLSFKQSIDTASKGPFEEHVHHASYEEFLLKSQVYNQDGLFKTFSEMKLNDGRANSLHYKTGFAVGGFISLLKNKIPGLQNTSAQDIVFDEYRFELIESDISDRSVHAVAIHYHTNTLTLIDSFGDKLLLAYGDKTQEAVIDDCFLLQLQPGLSIMQYVAVALESISE